MALDEAEQAGRQDTGAAWRWAGVGVVVAVALGVAIYIAIEGDIGDAFVDFRDWIFQAVRRFGAFASFGLLYIEESGVPLPVPGDVYVTYLGHVASGVTWRLFATWLGIIAVVTAGATNLYMISRRWGPRLIEGRLGHVLHLDEKRLKTADDWFRRYGVLAMIFGRHIPGFRVPLTVVAATLKFPYRLFAPSVAVSTSIWAGVFIILGDRFGRGIARFLATHAWVYGAGTLIVVGIVLYIAVGVLLEPGHRAPVTEQKPPRV